MLLERLDEIITGHTRILAAAKLGIEEVPAIVASDLSPAQIKAFRIADNKVAEYSEWDEKYVDVIINRYINFKQSDEGVYLIRDGKQIEYSEVKVFDNIK